jgi:ketosteroid isomerase-like protein
MIRSLTGLTFAAIASASAFSGTELPAQTKTDQASAVSGALAAAALFHAALARGDSAAVVQLLASDAIILESGDIETHDEYIAHHLGEDIAFAMGVASQQTIVQARRDGNVVWILAKSVSKGTFNQKPVDSLGAELMVLSKTDSAWLIRAIHWSSRRRPSP